MVFKLLTSMHRVLGFLLSALFFLWFASGIVMIYHSFPRATQEKRVRNLAELSPGELPSLARLPEALPDTARARSLSLVCCLASLV